MGWHKKKQNIDNNGAETINLVNHFAMENSSSLFYVNSIGIVGRYLFVPPLKRGACIVDVHTN